jgi:hypothetical protein
MSASDFFNRWSKRKAEAVEAESLPGDAAPPAVAATTVEQKPLTLADVEKLTPESDFSAFLAGGVDEDVKRSALKKLFADPHFNVMDELDTYVDDYSKPDPIPPAMLAALNHAKDLLDPLRVSSTSEKALMALLDPEPVKPETLAQDEDESSAGEKKIALSDEPPAHPTDDSA